MLLGATDHKNVDSSDSVKESMVYQVSVRAIEINIRITQFNTSDIGFSAYWK